MLNVGRIHEWRGQEVRDRDDEKLGKLDEVYYDARTGEPAFISVKSGLLGRRNNLVALADATVGREYVRVAHAAAEVSDVETDEVDGRLNPDALRAAAQAYGVTVNPDGEYESATLLSGRRAQAAEVSKRADELEQMAARRAQEAEVSRGRAHDAAQARDVAEEERDDAQQAAEAAREDAERAARDAPPSLDAG